MHWYRRNIGDYLKKAGRLSMLQHGAYTMLLDSCYDRERFPTEEEALDWTWASTQAEEDAVRFVLKRFFVLQGDGRYVQKRVEEELRLFFEKAEKNRIVALYREYAKKERKAKRNPLEYDDWVKQHEPCEPEHDSCTTGTRPNQDRSPTQYPVPNTQYPVPNSNTSMSGAPDGTPPEEAPPEDDPPEVVIELPTNRFNTIGETYKVLRSEVDEFAEAYPAVDIEDHLRRMRQWLKANTTRRKTLGGMPKFMNNWLADKQDKGGTNRATHQTSREQKPESNHSKVTRLCAAKALGTGH